MSENGLLTDSMLAKELGVGQATLKFWLNRFNRWLPYTMENGKKWYHPSLITPLILIADHFSTGMLPSDIESALDAHATDNTPSRFQRDPSHHPHPSPSPPRGDDMGSNRAPDLLSALTAHQERIAIAQERRAVAEEKKAEALLKRAEAEALKAKAFDSLADAIKSAATSVLSGKFSGQDLTPPPPVADDTIAKDDDSLPNENETIVQESGITTSSSPKTMDDTIHQNDDMGAHPSDPYEAAFDEDETNPILQGLEDLSQRLHDDDPIYPPDITEHDPQENGNEKEYSGTDKTKNENHGAETALPIDLNASEIDDLSALIESDSPMIGIDEEEEDIDDLFALIGNEKEMDGAHDMLHDMPDISGDMDDLASLIDDHHDISSLDLLPTPEEDLSKFNEEENGDFSGINIDHSDGDREALSDLIDFNGDETDDLSSLLSDEEMDDLSSIRDTTSTPNNGEINDTEMDDLFALIDAPPSEVSSPSPDGEMDDLSSLIDTAPQENEKSTGDPEAMDDLFALIDPPPSEVSSPSSDGEMDDLSSLIDAPSTQNNGNINDAEMDDLFALIDAPPSEVSPPSSDGEMDDLSSLIDAPSTQNNGNINDAEMDDLSSLIDSNGEGVPTQSEVPNKDVSPLLDNNREKKIKKQSPKIKNPTVSFDENFAQFKSEVINIIINLKKEGYTIEETTDLLNEEKITTLSGKNRWSKKMIGKIYTFIEAAAR